MINKFEINGVKVFAEYNSGQSRFGEKAVDFELVRIGDIELYAEAEPTEDWESFEELSAEIARQAEEKGIDLDLYNPVFG